MIAWNLRTLLHSFFCRRHRSYSTAHSSATAAANHLAVRHLKAGSFDSALFVLDGIPQPNLVTYNLKISCYNHLSNFTNSFTIFSRILHSDFNSDQFTFAAVLSACSNAQNLNFGQQVHSFARKCGFLSNGFVLTGLIELFSKHGSFDDALKVFFDVRTDNVVCWNALIAGGVRNGEYCIALDLFKQMVRRELYCMPNSFTFSIILSACALDCRLDEGLAIHAWVLKCDAHDDVVVGTAIVDMYAKCGEMEAALRVFSVMPSKNVVSWTAVISGFVQDDNMVAAINFFKKMILAKVNINRYTITSLLSGCGNILYDEIAAQIHCWILKTGLYMDLVVRSSLINVYAKIGYVNFCDNIFADKNVVGSPGLFSAMICGLAQNRNSERAIELLLMMFREYMKPDKFCCSSVLSLVECVDLGRQLHCYLLKTNLLLDVLVMSALFTMYSKCGSLEESYELFKQMPDKDGVAWSSMISGFAEHDCPDMAIHLFRQMMHRKNIIPDHIALSGILKACNSTQVFLTKGKEIHGYALRVGFSNNAHIGGPLVTMYSKYNRINSAKEVFDGVSQKDQCIWSSMISGYAMNGYNVDALSEFCQMRIAGHGVDEFTCSYVLGICALLSRPVLGRQVHASIIRAGLKLHLSVSSSLLTMYSKCGSLHESCEIFNEIQNPDMITYTTIINAYAQHGRGSDALLLFEKMKDHGLKPDSMAMVAVLSACNHSGLVDEGLFHFNSIMKDYGFEPTLHHYACVVDLLGRAGRLKEAADFIHGMPVEPDYLIWSSLLGACRVYGDVELGKFTAKKLLEVYSCNSGGYISLSNIAAGVGNWDEVVKIRGSMNQSGVRKEAGWSKM